VLFEQQPELQGAEVRGPEPPSSISSTHHVRFSLLTRLPLVAARCLSCVPLPTVCPIAARVTWRIVYRLDLDAIVIAEVFSKKNQTTPQQVIDVCRRRLREYDRLIGEEK